MHHVSANYTVPTILNSVMPAAGNAQAKSATAKASATPTSGTTTSTTSSTSTDLGTTFLNLLAQELQNQDPTNPVDSTAMVGQMISLNQLDHQHQSGHHQRHIHYDEGRVAASRRDGQQQRAGDHQRRSRQHALTLVGSRGDDPVAI